MTTSNEKPNIVLINCDDLGYGDLGCYGSTVNKTPFLDQMASDGVRFTDFYMASPVCSPSRGAMMTGCYPSRIGFGLFNGHHVLYPCDDVGLNPDEITIATLLKNQGYATRLVGKWHCGDQREFLPTRHGFDGYYGLPYSNDMGMSSAKNSKRRGYPPLPLLRDEEVVQEQPDQASLTERYMEDAVRFIRSNRNQPFFLYFAHMYVHTPLFVPKRFLDAAENGPYGAAVECVDWAAGTLLRELDLLGLADDTLVIFTSDNGSNCRNGGSNAPLRGKKGTTWEGGQRVPCLMRWPGRIPAGTVCGELATAMDFLPALAGLAGAKTPADRIIDGVDIRPLMFNPESAESPRGDFFFSYQDRLEAVRSGDWKLHVRKGDQEVKELYDLTEDVGETRNRYDDHPEIVVELERKLDAWRNDLGDQATGAVGANVRPSGKVDSADTLTHFDPNHPYIIASYD